MRVIRSSQLVYAFVVLFCITAGAQSPNQRKPDLSNKALITKSTPGIKTDAFTKQSLTAAIATLHKLADDYYAWRNENYPVRSSEAGLHTWDDRLTDYSPAKIAERAQRVRSLLDKVRGMKTDNWPKDERIDWVLFRAQLENVEFGDRVLKFEWTNPQVYTSAVEARPEQFAKPGETVCATGYPVGALDRSAFEEQPDGARCGPVA